MGKKYFNKILDINNIEQKYPTDAFTIFFNVADNNRYLLFALYTKKDLTEPALIELTEENYNKAKEKYLAEINEPIELKVNGIDDIVNSIIDIQLQSTFDIITIGQSLGL